MGSARAWWLGVVCALAVSACGFGITTADPAEQRTGQVGPTDGGDATVSAAPTAVSSAPAATPIERSTASIPPVPPRPDDELRGADVDWFSQDTELTIFGIGDTLNARAQPGLQAPVVAIFDPRRERPIATGRARQVADDTVWIEVGLDRLGTAGWVDRRLVGVAGPTENIASEIPAGDSRTLGADALDLGVSVMRALGHDPEGMATVLVSQPMTRDGQARVTFDVRHADDAILGERIRIVGVMTDEPDERRFELQRVERTLVCARGVSDGLCR